MDLKNLLRTSPLPKHIAIVCEDSSDEVKRDYALVGKIAMFCFKQKIPVVSFLLLPEPSKQTAEFSQAMDGLSQFFKVLSSWDYITKNQVKVSVIGKWYDLPGRVVDPIKAVLDLTRDYDRHFLNFCVNYDGQGEIVASAQVIARLVKQGKLDPSAIGKEHVKENLYSSYFIPPDLIIKTGRQNCTRGIFLWDSASSTVYFSGKPWTDFAKDDISKALSFYASFLR
ncbi:MAG: undecaprenyl diphosphate synthase family protein [Candidatus Woesearchaeota archaeon]